MLKRLDVRPDHRPVPLPAEDTAPKLQGQSLLIQQQLIVEDVLYVLGGIPGQYLYLQPTAPDTSLLYQPTDPAETSPEGILRQIRQVYQWYIHPSLDSSLAVVITPLLTLGSHYIMVQEFIREYSPMRAGQVNQALCAAIRDMLQEYHTLIAQLEHLHRRATVRDPFTLQKVSFYVQPSARVFERLVVLICTMKRKTEQEFRMLRRKEYQEYLEQCQTHPTSALPSYTSDSYTATKFGTVTNVANEAQYFQGVTAPPEHPRDPNLYPTADQGMISFDELEPVRGSADTAVGQNQPRGDLSKRLVVCRGGRTLKVIAEQMTATGGDPMAKRLYGFLLSRSARPFFRMLQTWLRCGEVEDPWKEFMIRRNDSSKKKAGPGEGLFAETLDHLGASEGSPSAGLVHRHLICLDMTPSFLHLVCKKVLLSGTYLNIIRACKTNAYSSSTAEDLCMMDIEPDASQDRLFAEESFIGMETLESGRETVDTHHSDAVTEAFDGQLHILKIENAYRYANKTLLWILLEQNQLLNRLRALKHYFFLDQSDFLTHFLDLSQVDLNRSSQEVSLVKLQSLLDIVLQNSASVGASDPFKEDLKVELTSHRFVDQLQLVQSTSGAGGNHRTSTPGTNSGKRTSGHFSDRTPNHGGTPKTPGDWESGETTPLATSRTPWQQSRQVGGGHSAERPSSTYRNRSESASLPRPLSSYGGGQSAPMKCLEALSFDFVVAFPVSMVINPTLMTKYQLIFRHLLQLKYAEHLLCTGWMGSRAPMTFRRQPLVNSAQTQMSLTLSQRVRKVYERIWFLRNSMLNCLRQIIYYTCFEVLEARWLALEAKVSTVTTIDELTMVHSVFLDHCLQQCMLTVPKLMKILGKLISKCVMFSTFSGNLLRSDTFLRPHTLSGESTGPLSSTTSGQLPTTSGNGRSSALSSLQSLQDALTEGDESAAASYVPLKSAPDSYDSLTHQELNLHKMEKSFQQNLEQFLNALNFYSDTETPLFLNLVTKLNLNGYYGSSSQ